MTEWERKERKWTREEEAMGDGERERNKRKRTRNRLDVEDNAGKGEQARIMDKCWFENLPVIQMLQSFSL